MQYLLMCCIDEDRWNALPEARREEIMREYARVLEDADRSGRHVASARLRPSSSATTLRERDGRPVVTDGPFAETKEQFGGYHVIECADLDEALAFAARIPTLPAGGVIEVRPVLESHGRGTAALNATTDHAERRA